MSPLIPHYEKKIRETMALVPGRSLAEACQLVKLEFIQEEIKAIPFHRAQVALGVLLELLRDVLYQTPLPKEQQLGRDNSSNVPPKA